MKKAFTLMETVFVIIVVGFLINIVINKILSDSQKAQITNTVRSDAKTIIAKINEWKSNNPTARQNLLDMSPADLADYMPVTNPVENYTNTKKGDTIIISSSGYGKYLTYSLKPISPVALDVIVDYSNIIKDNDLQKKYGKQIGNIFINLSTDRTKTSIDSKIDGTGGKVKVNSFIP